MNIAGLLDPAIRQRACAFLNEERMSHALSFHKDRTRAQSIGAWLLLEHALLTLKLSEKFKNTVCSAAPSGVTEVSLNELMAELEALTEEEKQRLLTLTRVRKGEHGKPYLKDRKDMFFNLSHSGDYVLCAVSDREVGADIQKRHDRDVTGILRKILNSREQTDDFFLLFSAKEAFVKCMGDGLSRDFSHLLVEPLKKKVTDTVTGESLSLLQFRDDGEYVITVCSRE